MGSAGRAVTRIKAPIQNLGELKDIPGTVKKWGTEIGDFAGLGDPYQPNAGAFTPNAQEQEYISKLQNLAYGKTPSPAELQMQKGLGQATAQSQAVAASARGLSPALAQRLASMQQVGMAQNVNQDAAILRAQEHQANMGMLGNELQSVRTGQMGHEGLKANAFENQQQRRSNFAGGLFQAGAQGAAMAAHRGGQVPGYNGGGGVGLPSHPPAIEGGTGGFPAERAGHGAPPKASTKASVAKRSDRSDWKSIQSNQSALINPMQMPNVMTIESPRSEIGQRLSGMAHGGMTEPAGQISGEPPYPGDNPKNDTIPIMASPGEIIIPNSILEHEHAGEMAKSFVEGILAGQGGKKKDNFVDGGKVDEEESTSSRFGKAAGKMFYDKMAPIRAGIGLIGNEVVPAVSGFIGGLGEGVSQAQMADSPQAPVEASIPTTDVNPGPMSMGEATPPMLASPAQPSNMDRLAAQYGGSAGLGTIRQGIQQQGSIESALGQRVAAHRQEAQDAMDLQTNAIANAKFDYDMEREKLLADVADDKIDPNQYLDNMSTGSKVMTAIGLVLGGMGSGLTGQPNAAIKFLNDRIDRDIMAQKENMGKKQNMFSLMRQKYQDDVAAADMTKANLLAIAQLKVQEEIDRASGPLAKARGQQLLGQLQLQEQELAQKGLSQAVAAQAMMDPKAAPEQKINYIKEDSDRKKATEELEMVNAYNSAVNNAQSIYGKAKNLSLLASKTPGSSDRAALKMMNAQIEKFGREGLRGQGTVQESEVQRLLAPYFITGEDLLFKDLIDQKNQGFNDMLAVGVSKGTPTLTRYNINPSGPRSSAPQSSIPEGATASNPKGERIIMQGGKWVKLGK